MFSTTPTIRWPVWRATTPERSATSAAAGCGVVTTTTSAFGRSWPSEIATSPVPGGRSTSSTSRSPKYTSVRNWLSVRCSIGPRQATATDDARPPGSVGSTNMPIEITFTPCATGGRIISSTRVGRARVAVRRRRGRAGPGSRTRARRRRRAPPRGRGSASATARLAVIVDLPTPPLPLVIAMTRVRRARAERVAARGPPAAQALGQGGALLGRHHREGHVDARRRPRRLRRPGGRRARCDRMPGSRRSSAG